MQRRSPKELTAAIISMSLRAVAIFGKNEDAEAPRKKRRLAYQQPLPPGFMESRRKVLAQRLEARKAERLGPGATAHKPRGGR